MLYLKCLLHFWSYNNSLKIKVKLRLKTMMEFKTTIENDN